MVKKNSFFNVRVYEGNGTKGNIVDSGDDDAHCKIIGSDKEVLRAMGNPKGNLKSDG